MKQQRSVSSQEFTYTPSKNIYWEKLMHLPRPLEGLAFTDHATEEHRGNWRSRFKAAKDGKTESSRLRTEPSPGSPQDFPPSGSPGVPTELPPTLHVEIGCNAGHVVVEWAKLNPQDRYIGIDWKFKQVYRLAEKIAKNNLANLLAFRANAERLPFMFAAGEIDFLHMFFPDPWPKKAQKKNRTANTDWLRSVAPLLSGRGYFHFKTDHREYFEYVLENLSQLKDVYEIIEVTHDLHANHPDPKSLKIPEVTLFERLFIKDSLPIHSVKVKSLIK